MQRALLLFAAGTIVSMALLSSVFGLVIARGPVDHKLIVVHRSLRR